MKTVAAFSTQMTNNISPHSLQESQKHRKLVVLMMKQKHFLFNQHFYLYNIISTHIRLVLLDAASISTLVAMSVASILSVGSDTTQKPGERKPKIKIILRRRSRALSSTHSTHFSVFTSSQEAARGSQVRGGVVASPQCYHHVSCCWDTRKNIATPSRCGPDTITTRTSVISF